LRLSLAGEYPHPLVGPAVSDEVVLVQIFLSLYMPSSNDQTTLGCTVASTVPLRSTAEL
jgi:hypothetical protein